MPQWNFYKYLLDHEGNVLQVCTVLYYILYCIVLYCTALYCTAGVAAPDPCGGYLRRGGGRGARG